MRWLAILLLLLVPLGNREKDAVPGKVQIAMDLGKVGKKVDPDFTRNYHHRPSGKLLVVTFESMLVRREPLGAIRILWVEVTVVYRRTDEGKWELLTWR